MTTDHLGDVLTLICFGIGYFICAVIFMVAMFVYNDFWKYFLALNIVMTLAIICFAVAKKLIKPVYDDEHFEICGCQNCRIGDYYGCQYGRHRKCKHFLDDDDDKK